MARCFFSFFFGIGSADQGSAIGYRSTAVVILVPQKLSRSILVGWCLFCFCPVLPRTSAERQVIVVVGADWTGVREEG